MKDFKRFACFLIPFAIVFAIGNTINSEFLGSFIAGIGFTIAYCFGKND